MTGRLAQARTDLEAKNTELERRAHEPAGVAAAPRAAGAAQGRALQVRARVREEAARARVPNATELEKKTVEVSVLFLDIAGYTKLSEQLEPRKLNQLVQTYFTSFLEIIQAHHGDVNETAGDGLMVIFQSERGGDRSRAQRDAGRLRDPPAHGEAQRGVRRRLPGDPAPHGHQHGRVAGGRHQAAGRAGRSRRRARRRTSRRASRAPRRAARSWSGPTTAERIRAHVRAGEPGRAHVQEREPADPRCSR